MQKRKKEKEIIGSDQKAGRVFCNNFQIAILNLNEMIAMASSI